MEREERSGGISFHSLEEFRKFEAEMQDRDDETLWNFSPGEIYAIRRAIRLIREQ
jgi:hypothetical protein